VKLLVRLRAAHPAFQRDVFFTGSPPAEGERKDIAWLTPAGREMTEADWHGHGRAIGVFIGLRPCLAVLLNASDDDVPFVFADQTLRWQLVLDTARDGGRESAVPSTYVVARRSIAVFNVLDA
jgi:glycogen operon protein